MREFQGGSSVAYARDVQDGRVSRVSRVRPSPLGELESAVEDGVALSEAQDVDATQLAHEMTANQFRIFAAILACERAGSSREQILTRIAPIRELASRSPLMRRAQTWPRGYPGDYEMIEDICNGGNRASPRDVVAFMLEAFAQQCAPVQQHRNKVHQQARLLLEAFLDGAASGSEPRAGMARAIRSGSEPRVLSIATGPSHDVRSVAHLLGGAGRLVLNDADPEALEFTKEHLRGIASMCDYVPGNIFRVYKKIAAGGRFDLVLAGGLFDYLNDRLAEHLVHIVLEHLVKPGGRFFFTNIACGNPYRCLMEYVVDWPLIERTEEDIAKLCKGRGEMKIAKDTTGLTWLVEVRPRSATSA